MRTTALPCWSWYIGRKLFNGHHPPLLCLSFDYADQILLPSSGDANAYKLAFWIMSYILFDSDLYTALVAETSPAIRDNGDIDMPYLAQHCPLLCSVYSEALRLRKRDLAFRQVETDTHIGGKVLRGGNLALVPMCQLHDDRSVFGEDAGVFHATRFQNKAHFQNCTSYKPYGGGKTYCPGRFFAMQEIFAFVAVMLNKYSMQKQQGCRQFPRPDESSLTLGVSRPLPGQDLQVHLTNPGVGNIDSEEPIADLCT
jgi:cytochrome P450